MNGRRWLLLAGLAVLVFVGLAAYGDLRDLAGRVTRFPLPYLAVALGLAAINYLLRFLRWQFYLRTLSIPVPVPVSALVFLGGLALSITPGKLGELVKSYLLRDRSGVPVTLSAPVVLMERFTDVIAVALVGMAGLALPASQQLPLLVSLVLLSVLLLCAVAALLVFWRRGDRLLDLPLVRRWGQAVRESQEGMRRLLGFRPLAVALLLALLAWCSEGLALWVILRGLDAEISVLQAVPIYAAATLVGAISTLPGGLVGTEGSMVALLQQAGVSRGPAAAATLLVRLATLWFAVVIGLAALVCWRWRRPRPVAEVSPSPGI
ncbi:MAG: flippase-like domain-containing protein [SAR202 cluster bacterium]|nr:flippase-like domain-containing protein [SAR202 cluster bacterium]